MMRGAALLAPAPNGYQPATMPGTAPGPAAGIFRARIVIVSGPSAGLFVYAGTPALGNPPVFWATSAATDPFGNVIPSTSGVAASGTFRAGNTITNASGTVAYTGNPAAGNMLFSDAPVAFTDASGNSVLAGFTAYTASTAINIGPGGSAPLTWYSGTQAAWTPGTAMAMQVVNQLTVFCNAISQIPVTGSGVTVVSYNLAGVLQLAAQAVTPGATSATAANLWGNALGNLTVQNNKGLIGNMPAVQVDTTTGAAGNDALLHNLTTSWPVPAGDGAKGTIYTIKGFILLNTGQTTIQLFTIGVTIDGVNTALATLGASFNGGALNTGYDCPLELTLVVDDVALNTPLITLDGPLGDISANRLATNSANMAGHTGTASWAKASAHTWSVTGQWGGAGGTAQSAQMLYSKLTREGP